MLSKELFIETVEAINKQFKKDIEISEHLGRAFPNAFTPNLLPDNRIINEALIKILKMEMNDKSNWVEYFMYDLNFGEENYRLKVYDNKKEEIPLTTTEDLYNLLTEENE